jgi:hypothetical protein
LAAAIAIVSRVNPAGESQYRFIPFFQPKIIDFRRKLSGIFIPG